VKTSDEVKFDTQGYTITQVERIALLRFRETHGYGKRRDLNFTINMKEDNK